MHDSGGAGGNAAGFFPFLSGNPGFVCSVILLPWWISAAFADVGVVTLFVLGWKVGHYKCPFFFPCGCIPVFGGHCSRQHIVGDFSPYLEKSGEIQTGEGAGEAGTGDLYVREPICPNQAVAAKYPFPKA